MQILKLITIRIANQLIELIYSALSADSVRRASAAARFEACWTSDCELELLPPACWTFDCSFELPGAAKTRAKNLQNKNSLRLKSSK